MSRKENHICLFRIETEVLHLIHFVHFVLHLVDGLRKINYFRMAEHGRVIRIKETIAFSVGGNGSHVQVEEYWSKNTSLRNTKFNLYLLGCFVIDLNKLLMV